MQRIALNKLLLRDVNLLGIDSVFRPMGLRRELWQRLARDLKPTKLDSISREVTLDELSQVTASLLSGGVRGRMIVRLS
jgi:acrylyl-CoA reductase (NADPH)